MISQTAEYALRVVVHLASLQSRGESDSQTTRQIADHTCVPVDYLSKILRSLGRGGLMTTQRGPGGGFQLARAANQITIYDVVQAVDSLPRIHRCPLGLEAHAVHLCPLHKRLDETMEAAENSLRQTTIAMLLDGAPLFADAGLPAATFTKARRGRAGGRRTKTDVTG